MTINKLENLSEKLFQVRFEPGSYSNRKYILVASLVPGFMGRVQAKI